MPKILDNPIPKGWPVYRIVRFYRDGRPRRTIRARVSEIEAQAHCHDPKTRKEGVYFDGYDLMPGFKKREG